MKYKLKKWYPSLPDGMEVGDTVERFNGKSYHPFNNPNKNAIYSKEVENNPEFWEPVEEKDYEILSWFCKNMTIKSVKRLSDGEVFTVGDRIIDPFYNSNKEIEKIYLYQNHIRINLDHNILSRVQKLKQPLFTTEDGVDIYEGDSYYSLYFYGNHCANSPHIRTHPQPASNWKTFSTKEKAEQYAEENKPQYSKKDVERAINSYKEEFLHTIHTNHIINRL